MARQYGQATPEAARSIKQRTLHSLGKLNDRDTRERGYDTLCDIVDELGPTTLRTFLNVMFQTNRDQSVAARKEAVRVFGHLAVVQQISVFPHLNAIMNFFCKRLRDNATQVTRAVSEATGSLVKNVVLRLPQATPQNLAVFFKGFFALMGEKNKELVIAAGVCVTSVVANGGALSVGSLPKLAPRILRLLGDSHFYGRAQLMNALRHLIELSRDGSIDIYIPDIVAAVFDCLSSADWTTRKAAVECTIPLSQLHPVIRNYSGELKEALESCKHDRVKPVRDCVTVALTYFNSSIGLEEMRRKVGDDGAASPARARVLQPADKPAMRPTVRTTPQKKRMWAAPVAKPPALISSVPDSSNAANDSFSEKIEMVAPRFDVLPESNLGDLVTQRTIADQTVGAAVASAQSSSVAGSDSVRVDKKSIDSKSGRRSFANLSLRDSTSGVVSRITPASGDSLRAAAQPTEEGSVQSSGPPVRALQARPPAAAATSTVSLDETNTELSRTQRETLTAINTRTQSLSAAQELMMKRMTSAIKDLEETLGQRLSIVEQRLTDVESRVLPAGSPVGAPDVERLRKKPAAPIPRRRVSFSEETIVPARSGDSGATAPARRPPSGEREPAQRRPTGSPAVVKQSHPRHDIMPELQSPTAVVWSKIETLTAAFHFEEAYAQALQSGNEHVVIRLCGRTGPCLDSLEIATICDLFSFFIHFLKHREWVEHVFPWVQQLVGLGIRMSDEEMEDLSSALEHLAGGTTQQALTASRLHTLLKPMVVPRHNVREL